MLLAWHCMNAQAAINILANRYDNNRTAANLTETALSPSTVSEATFGKLWSYSVDGDVYAQPLYVQGVTVAGASAPVNVLYVATMHDVVYAFNADKPGGPLWTHDYRATGVTPGTPFDSSTASDGMGIIGTPVIDAPNYKMYLVTETMENGQYVQRLHALDIRSGVDLAATVITASAKGVTFDPKQHSQRPGLILADGQVWLAFASTIPGDWNPWHGWVMTYNASTLAQTGVFVTTTTGSGGGIWHSGGAPAIDAAGNVYFLTGNGTGQAYDGVNNFQESLLKFNFTGNALSLVDWYTPELWSTYDAYDLDVTCNGPMLIPGTDLVAFGGKVALTTVLHSGSLGKLTANDTQIVQSIQTGPAPNYQANDGDRIIGLAYWQRPANSLMFVWPGMAALTSYTFNGSQFTQSQQLASNLFGEPSAALSISANGATVGSGILWAVHNVGAGRTIGQPAVLEAYNADNLNNLLWSSTTNKARDDIGSSGRFVIPVVNNGRVYMATASGAVQVYGLLPVSGSGATAVNLASIDNLSAIAANGTQVGGIGSDGYAYSATLLGPTVTWNGETFNLGSAGAPDAVTSATISLPPGHYSSLSILGTGIYGTQVNQVFTVTYSDGSTVSFTQSLSDWALAQNFPGETPVVTTAYRVTPSGATQNGPWNLYGYTFALNSAKIAQTLTLPANRDVVVFAADVYGSGSVAAPNPSFSLSAHASSVTVTPPTCFGAFCFGGGAASDAIAVAGANGFSGTVSFSVSGLPSGVTAAFSAQNVAGGGSSTLTFTPSSSAASHRTATVTVKGIASVATVPAATTTITLNY